MNFILVDMQVITSIEKLTSFASISKFMSAFLITFTCVCSEVFPYTYYVLLVLSLTNKLGKIFDMCTFS